MVDAVLTAVMVVTPTVLYVGFWRLLMKLRDDDLINRLDQEMNLTAGPDRSGTPSAVGVPALDASDLDPELDRSVARRMKRKEGMRQCPECWTLNSPGDEECHACGTELTRSGPMGLFDRFRT